MMIFTKGILLYCIWYLVFIHIWAFATVFKKQEKE